jgi:hypothetical protein
MIAVTHLKRDGMNPPKGDWNHDEFAKRADYRIEADTLIRR